MLRHVLLAVFCYLMTTDSFKIFQLNLRKTLPASQWNQGLQYFPMVLGGTLMFVFIILKIIVTLIDEIRPAVVHEKIFNLSEEGDAK